MPYGLCGTVSKILRSMDFCKHAPSCGAYKYPRCYKYDSVLGWLRYQRVKHQLPIAGWGVSPIHRHCRGRGDIALGIYRGWWHINSLAYFPVAMPRASGLYSVRMAHQAPSHWHLHIHLPYYQLHLLSACWLNADGWQSALQGFFLDCYLWQFYQYLSDCQNSRQIGFVNHFARAIFSSALKSARMGCYLYSLICRHC